MLATPIQSGASATYVHMLMALYPAMQAAGIPMDWAADAENYHGDDARNGLVRKFLTTDCTDLLFIDSDEWIDAEGLVAMVLAGADADIVIGGVPKRNEWMDFNINFKPGEIWGDRRGLIEIDSGGTGCMLIRRHVLERMSERYAHTAFHGQRDDPKTAKPMHVLFERTMRGGRRTSADIEFCKRWTDLGGTIHLFPELHVEHVGEQAWRGHIGNWLRARNNIEDNTVAAERLHELDTDLAAFIAGDRTVERIGRLIADWGNENWSGDVELVAACIDLAEKAEGPILECGAGITSLLMAVVSQQEVWTLEHKSQWFERVKAVAQRHAIDNLRIWFAPLKDYTAFSWYVLPEETPRRFALALLDGPEQSNKGGRAGFMQIMGERLPGAVVIIDDLLNPKTASLVERWEDDLGVKFTRLGSHRLFAIGRLPAASSTTSSAA